jgi:outer membrane protein assembly factor BamB
MYCHDVQHTGRSPYSTANNLGIEKWRFNTEYTISGSPVIDSNDIIYIGSYDLYAVNPDGSFKWKYNTGGVIEGCSAIDKNGIVYVGTKNAVYGNYLYAIYPDGTLKWKYDIGEDDIHSSPTIGDDCVIYIGVDDGSGGDVIGSIRALNPNGTLKWSFRTNHVVYSSPAIGEDGTVYCGCHDGNLYALNQNGTLKWIFPTDNWIHGSPTIANDGTIYIGSDDKNLYAIYSNNGTEKWHCNVGSMYASPALDDEGILYFGVWEEKFYAIYPNGDVKWSFNLGSLNGVWDSSAAISEDGTIYFGMCYDMGSGTKGDIIALNQDGTEKWRKEIGRCHSSPVIGKDGTVYICNHANNGILYAFGYPGPNPLKPTINGPSNGKPGTSYDYQFSSIDPDGDDVQFEILWGDGDTEWTEFTESGKTITKSHKWTEKSTYEIKAKAVDINGYESNWGTLTVRMPRNSISTSPIFMKLLERFPNAFLLLEQIFIKIQSQF